MLNSLPSGAAALRLILPLFAILPAMASAAAEPAGQADAERLGERIASAVAAFAARSFWVRRWC